MGTLQKNCSNCRHKWFVHGVMRCGCESVKQYSVEEARSAEGDCGPDGSKWLTVDEQR